MQRNPLAKGFAQFLMLTALTIALLFGADGCLKNKRVCTDKDGKQTPCFATAPTP